MLVRCKVCGKLNEKDDAQRSVKCPNCGATTIYWVTEAPVLPQTPEVVAILRQQEAEDLEKWRDAH